MNMRKYAGLLLLAALFASCGNNDDEKSLELSGNLEATTVTVSNKVSGELETVFVNEGKTVHEGDTLALIDMETAEILFRQAKANRNAIEAQYKLLLKGTRKEDLEQAESLYKQAEINYNLALGDLKRFESLFSSGSITQKQLDDATARTSALELQMKAVFENLLKLKSIARPEEIAQAKARLDQAVAAEELSAKNLRDCFITSPASGTVTKSFFEKGELIQPGSALFKITDLSVIKLVVFVEQQYIGKINLNNKTEVSIDSFPGELFEGNITYISPEAEFTPKNIQTKEERSKLVFGIKIEIQNSHQKLKVGIPADVKLLLN